jgi:hypothetical protein
MYVLHPGVVRDSESGQCHYVSASRLADLYRIPIDRWQVYDSREHHCAPPTGWVYVHLHPREDAIYRLPADPESVARA